MRNEEEIKSEFARLCRELNLKNTSDFGIINEDGKRTNEFLEYIENNQNLPKPIRYTYVELIMASMNESILLKIVNKDLKNRFKRYVFPKIGNKEWYPQIDYWIRIRSKDEFPVGYLLIEYSKNIKSEKLN